MANPDAQKLHTALGLAGFRALATAAGLLQLTRELQSAGVLDAPAVERIREAMLHELLANVARPLAGKASYEEQLRNRLKALFSGAANLNEGMILPPKGAAENS
jgi:hypothetical protein